MNKKEAIEGFKMDNMLLGASEEGVVERNNIAIQALEEIQVYREMEQRLKNIYGECDGLLETAISYLESHNSIDFPGKVGKSKLLTDEDVDRWEAYKTIGAVEECRVAVEKMKPKKPIDRCMYKECPCCGNVEIEGCGYCPECGQAIEWDKNVRKGGAV